MPATELMPNIDNYFVGTGVVKWMANGGETMIEVGNVSKWEYTTTATRLKHYSSMAGTRVKDDDVVIQVDAALSLTMDEFTSNNLGMALLGSVTIPSSGGTAGDGNPSLIDLGTNPQITGWFRLIGKNDIGPMVQMDLPSVSITPQGALSLINASAWGEITLTAEVNANPETGSLGQLAWGISEEITYNGQPPS
jgi:hypothetical protein